MTCAWYQPSIVAASLPSRIGRPLTVTPASTRASRWLSTETAGLQLSWPLPAERTVVDVSGDGALGRQRHLRQQLVGDNLHHQGHAGEVLGRARRLADPRGECAGIAGAGDDGPGNRDLRLVRPVDEGHEHGAMRTGENGALDGRILEGRRNSFHL